MSETPQEPESPVQKPVIVKKYANRRLYNTESSSYITLDTLADMVRIGWTKSSLSMPCPDSTGANRLGS